eukprot:TRINITY_DN25094_c0_g1_i1.p1 TRINITY_DN25094_c0_g1~~TRINITY_DN25094_c0_g1_i1.p1  ORF type:complete len:409 (+),score=81.64 TRINITY_DN25094_c0_g1_i1:36-1229(+)
MTEKRKREWHKDEWMCGKCGCVSVEELCRQKRCRSHRPKEGMGKVQGNGMRVVEFYSGIGGMHVALETSKIAKRKQCKVVAAWDVNENANVVYKDNFPDTSVFSTDLNRLTAAELDHLDAEMWLLAPPCQPYTRQGSRKGSEDPRAVSFLTMLDLLPTLHNQPRYILVENVLGFERSETFKELSSTLSGCGYTYQCLCLNAMSLGVPNSRPRMYILAKKAPLKFKEESLNGGILTDSADAADLLVKSGVTTQEECKIPVLRDFLNLDTDAVAEGTLLPEEQLMKGLEHVDIVTPSSTRSGCFTKAYAKRSKGSGSVLIQTGTEEDYLSERRAFREGEKIDFSKYKMRYFTPREVATLMGYPSGFKLTGDLQDIQHYRLLGNSLSIRVVGRLIEYLLA